MRFLPKARENLITKGIVEQKIRHIANVNSASAICFLPSSPMGSRNCHTLIWCHSVDEGESEALKQCYWDTFKNFVNLIRGYFHYLAENMCLSMFSKTLTERRPKEVDAASTLRQRKQRLKKLRCAKNKTYRRHQSGNGILLFSSSAMGSDSMGGLGNKLCIAKILPWSVWMSVYTSTI